MTAPDVRTTRTELISSSVDIFTLKWSVRPRVRALLLGPRFKDRSMFNRMSDADLLIPTSKETRETDHVLTLVA